MRDSRYVAFVAHFNGDRDYYECHEYMEELWLEEGRHPLLQALLQAAVGLHHWSNGNIPGAVKLSRLAHAKLTGQTDVFLGLDLAALRADLERSLSLLDRDAPRPALFTPYKLRILDEELERSVVQKTASDRTMPGFST